MFTDGSQFSLDQNRLIVTSSLGPSPYEKGQKYCKKLPYIKATGIGINFDVVIQDFDFQTWFGKHKVSADAVCLEIKVRYQSRCNITLTFVDKNTAKALFNFHYDHNKVLGELKLDLVDEWRKNHELVKTFLDSAIK